MLLFIDINDITIGCYNNSMIIYFVVYRVFSFDNRDTNIVCFIYKVQIYCAGSLHTSVTYLEMQRYFLLVTHYLLNIEQKNKKCSMKQKNNQMPYTLGFVSL